MELADVLHEIVRHLPHRQETLEELHRHIEELAEAPRPSSKKDPRAEAAPGS